MVVLMCGIFFVGLFFWKIRIIYVLVGVIILVGFLYFGIRGVVVVLLGGVVLYLFFFKNIKIFMVGLIMLGVVYYGLKYIYVFYSF